MPEIDIDSYQSTITSTKRINTSSSLLPLSQRYDHQNIPTPKVLDTEGDVTPYEMINFERQKRGLLPFRLSRTLNHLATQQANRMARHMSVYHSVSSIDELKMLLRGKEVAENIQRGDTIVMMHVETMRETNCINRSNVLSPYFSDIGYGVITGLDGKVYCCHNCSEVKESFSRDVRDGQFKYVIFDK
jgi:uncharacterized protein YkwD